MEISERYEIDFVEMGYESDHIHFLIQSVPSLWVSKIVRTLKSITGRELFRLHPEIKELLWGGKFQTNGYYANTVGQYGNKEAIRKYVENQGKEKECKKYIQGNSSCSNTLRLASGQFIFPVFFQISDCQRSIFENSVMLKQKVTFLFWVKYDIATNTQKIVSILYKMKITFYHCKTSFTGYFNSQSYCLAQSEYSIMKLFLRV